MPAPEMSLSIPVQVSITADDGGVATHTHTMRDISGAGIGIYTYRPIPVDEVVAVSLALNGLVWSGPMRVQHCTETVGGFKVGLRSMGESEPSAESESHFRPNDNARPAQRSIMEPAAMSEIRDEIRKTVRAYHLARSSWGLLGIGIRLQIRRTIRTLAGSCVPEPAGSKRKRPRSPANTDTRVIFRAYHGWRQATAWIMDVSEDGVGLAMPYDLLDDDSVEQELVGDLHVRVGMSMIIGLGCEPQRLWIPGEVVYCSEPTDRQVCAGVQFATPGSLQIFSA
jgi:hypothetical protein